MLRFASASILPWLRCAGKIGVGPYHARLGLRLARSDCAGPSSPSEAEGTRDSPERSPRTPGAQNAPA